MQQLQALLQWIKREVLLNPLVLLVIAVVSGGIGIMILLDSPTYLQRATIAEQLPSLSAANLEDAPLGQRMALEGVVSERNPQINGAFVAYIHEAYQSRLRILGASQPEWQTVEQQTPALWINVSDGDIRLANEDYVIDRTATTREDSEPTFTNGSTRTRGFVHNDPILVIGAIDEQDGQRTFKANLVYAGSRAEYLADLRATAERSLPIGVVLLLIAGVAMWLGIRETRRFLHELNQQQAEEEAKREAQRTAQQARREAAQARWQAEQETRKARQSRRGKRR